MDDGTIAVTWFPQLYWIFVGCVIATFALVNGANHLLYRQRCVIAFSEDELNARQYTDTVARMRAFTRKSPAPARPHNIFTRTLACATALTREMAHVSLPRLPCRFHILGWTPPTPSLGSVSLVAAHTLVLLVLGFYELDPTNYDNLQNIAYRWGFLTLGQVPLVFLLAGKESIIGLVTGHSYERLNWLHRWVARCMLLTATLHMGFWFGNWAPYDYIGYQIKNDRSLTQTGFGAWCILVWIVFSSMAPIRHLRYEFFLLQHIVSFTAFTTMVFIHTPASDHVWLWVPVGLFFLDRILRFSRTLSFNLVADWRLQGGGVNRRLAPVPVTKAEVLPGGMARVTIYTAGHDWKPGQHLFLLNSYNPLQRHPFTISSLPSDAKMEFVIKARAGATRRLLEWAEHNDRLPNSRPDNVVKVTMPCRWSRPYGDMRPLHQFDSVVLLAGSTGASFTMPLMRDIVRLWKCETRSGRAEPRDARSALRGALTRRVRFVWAVKAGEHVGWFAAQLHQAVDDVRRLRNEGVNVQLHISIYVTCDESFTADWNAMRPSRKKEVAPRSLPAIIAKRDDDDVVDDKTDTALNAQKSDTAHGQTFAVREVDPRAESLSSDATSHAADREKPQACGSDGTCCCRTLIHDESTAPAVVCTCHTTHPTTANNPPQDPPPTPKDPLIALAKDITLLSGRPHPPTIIRRTLESAHGESAVVVCGPADMNHDVRRAVVGLSDERAVGRSTGAYGVWFWGEGFGL